MRRRHIGNIRVEGLSQNKYYSFFIVGMYQCRVLRNVFLSSNFLRILFIKKKIFYAIKTLKIISSNLFVKNCLCLFFFPILFKNYLFYNVCHFHEFCRAGLFLARAGAGFLIQFLTTLNQAFKSKITTAGNKFSRESEGFQKPGAGQKKDRPQQH